MSDQNPRSIEVLESRLEDILGGDASAFAEGAAQIHKLVEEAEPHRLRHKLDPVIKVVEGKRAEAVLIHAVLENGIDDSRSVIVHPQVAAYYNCTVTLKCLEEELERADRVADWERAAAVAEATIQVFEQQDGDRPSVTGMKGFGTGRLEGARPDLHKRLTQAYANATRHVRDAVEMAAAAAQQTRPI